MNSKLNKRTYTEAECLAKATNFMKMAFEAKGRNVDVYASVAVSWFQNARQARFSGTGKIYA